MELLRVFEDACVDLAQPLVLALFPQVAVPQAFDVSI